MTCDELAPRLNAYSAGTLSVPESEALEAHASECDDCEALLEHATAGVLPTFAPALPDDLRATVLQAVSARQQRARATRMGRIAAVIGAAALLAVVVRPTGKQAQTVVADSSALSAAATSGNASSADLRARSEFIALDEAARELESALARAPNDKQLSDFLNSVTARRSDLERRVKDAL
jgi:hypothetical protein